MNKMNKIKEKVNDIIYNKNLIYAETIYDGEDREDGVWLYEFCLYDEENKIDKIEDELNKIKYVGAITSPNMDDGDYTIEIVIDLNNENISRNDMMKTVYL